MITMYKLRSTAKFKRDLKTIKKRGLDLSLLNSVIDKLVRGIPLEDKYRDHALKGEFKGFRECHIQPDWLLLYIIDNGVFTLTLMQTGTHADLFNK